MRTIPQLGKLLWLLVFSLIIFSCSNDDNGSSGNDDDSVSTTDDDANTNDNNYPNTLNIVDLTISVDVLSSLVDALEVADAGLVEALTADGTFTVFAPTNDAFNELLALLEGYDSLDDFDTDEEKSLLADILLYHIVADVAAFSTELSNGQVLETLQTEEITVNVDVSVFIRDKTEEEAEVVAADNKASNGVVHIIDKVLLPQAVLDLLFPEPEPKVVDIVVESEELSLLEEAVIAAGLVETLNGDGPFTIFAPNDEAIQALFDLLGDSYNSFDDFTTSLELDLLEDILLYHVVPDYLESTDLMPGTLTTLSTDQTIEVIAAGGFVIGDASDTDANLLDVDNVGSNGVVHIIDKILISQEVADLLELLGIDINNPNGKVEFTIKDLVENNEDLEFLEAALELTGLLDTLGEDGPFTVFAPSKNTLSLLAGLLGNSLDDLEDFDTDFEINLLRDVLLYHVAPGSITSNDLTVSTLPTLLHDDEIEIALTVDGFVLQDALGGLDANFIVTDIPAQNGVIHVIDRILIPQSVINTIVAETEDNIIDLLDALEGNELFTTALLLVRDSFENLVLDGQPFTFFLPTNQAFLNLFDALDGIDNLTDFDTQEELVTLGTILLYHCVDGVAAKSTEVIDGQVLTTFQGETLTVSLNGSVYIFDKTNVPANVTAPDKMVLNGVVHFIDKVLLPQEVIDEL
ncbi:MAG: fasciclin domain-containing protein [Bacteroidota bacterium]